MNVIRSQRTAASRVHMSASKLPPTFRPSSVSLRPGYTVSVRNLWWWSRRNEWSADEDLEERLLRHQKIMRNNYSKFLRHRSIWEAAENTRSPVWARSRQWLVTRWADKKALSYQRALQAEMQDPGKRSEHERPWKEWDRDYDKLKARIDEAVERDPYGTLFGRHLRGPPSPNNSSWISSFSWVYGPSRSISKSTSDASASNSSQHTKPDADATKYPSQRTIFSVPPRVPNGAETKQTSQADPEYEFDPISMRKVQKQKATSPDPTPSSMAPTSTAPHKRAFLETLFSEHGVDIPVKTYKPHQVYGHGGSEPKADVVVKETATAKPRSSGIGLESSRLRDLQALKLQILGTNIDTTAEYGGKYKVATDPEPIHLRSATLEPTGATPDKETSKMHDVKDTSGEDTATLFTGTTYEVKAKATASSPTSKPSFKTSWLEKEGFQTLPQALSNPEANRTEPAPSTRTLGKVSSSRIEPALDRVKASEVKTRSKGEPVPFNEKTTRGKEAEDVDLLRASDVRAGTRSARMTRSEIEQSKRETRKQLETDYSQRQLSNAEGSATHAESTTDRVSRSLSNVWEHVKQYPTGIVAKTINSMGIFNDNYKTYVRLDKPTQDSTEKLVFKDESLSKTPSIYKKIGKISTQPLHTFTPSQEVIDMEKAERARLAFVRGVKEASKNKAFAEGKRVAALASEIRNIYEQEYGKVDINHRQSASTPNAIFGSAAPPTPTGTAVTEYKKPIAAMQPMGPATVKPGVEEDADIKYHVSIFEPKLAKIVDELKSARKAIHESKLEYIAWRSRRPRIVWSGQSAESAPVSQPMSENTRIEPALNRTPERQTAVDKAIEKTEPVSAAKYNSEYIILAYDPSSKSVTTSPLDCATSSQDSARETGVPQILSSLNHTAKFLSHFTGLSHQGYEVISGGGDVLVFKKRSAKAVEPTKSPLLSHVKAIIDKNKLAAQEVSAQPVVNTVPTKDAATVLDEIPASEPRPGPVGPTAPPLGPPSFMRPKVRRQEDVFSASKASRVSSPPAASTAKIAQEEAPKELPRTPDGLWTRFKRGVRRVVLTAAAMGVGAYTIGAVAESLGAQQPSDHMIRNGRPGIYSTEHSR